MMELRKELQEQRTELEGQHGQLVAQFIECHGQESFNRQEFEEFVINNAERFVKYRDSNRIPADIRRQFDEQFELAKIHPRKLGFFTFTRGQLVDQVLAFLNDISPTLMYDLPLYLDLIHEISGSEELRGKYVEHVTE